ncbi:replication protein A 70 kDa DNA-binding subunit [Artemisia annua]|uniref:Replication protein A 70 kDa DNA-binding subunit n=1 Tax=Artemisia annua TaxID=35608 RepID=A0A2U1P2G0_ARTAN|nr:replication protein A 70 kDa DNA-binding subunit [Artemisia annua]
MWRFLYYETFIPYFSHVAFNTHCTTSYSYVGLQKYILCLETSKAHDHLLSQTISCICTHKQLDNCSSGHATDTFENLQPPSVSPYVNVPNPEKKNQFITSKDQHSLENENSYATVSNKRKGCQQDPFTIDAGKKLKGVSDENQFKEYGYIPQTGMPYMDSINRNFPIVSTVGDCNSLWNNSVAKNVNISYGNYYPYSKGKSIHIQSPDNYGRQLEGVFDTNAAGCSISNTVYASAPIVNTPMPATTFVNSSSDCSAISKGKKRKNNQTYTEYGEGTSGQKRRCRSRRATVPMNDNNPTLSNEGYLFNAGVSPLYIDIGDCCWKCQYCNAAFWYGERLKGTANRRVRFNRCCGGGQILDDNNELVQIFRTARDKCNEGNVPEFRVQLYNVVGAQQYQLPSAGTLGAIVFDDGPNTRTDYDIVVEYRDRGPQRINKLHSSYMSLQFPLLFVYGQPGMSEAYIKDLKPRDRNKILEAKIYRAWIHRDLPDTTDKGFRAILLDKQGDAIQANMNADDINHFKKSVIPGKTYRISGFNCVDTDNWQQTLANPTSLSFTRFFTTFDEIEDTGFPDHYFDFASYNELPDRVIDPKQKPRKPYPVLTDYIGCYIRSGDKGKVGNPNKRQSVQRKVEIQNLNRESLELTLWGDLAEKFNKEGIDALERPIIIAVSSCRVSRYNNNLQLQSTAATYFYINPRIPQLEQYRAEYRELHNLRPPLQIIKQAFQDKDKEKTRNRIPLADLIQEKPHTHVGVRFTCDGTIESINTTREWYYVSCNICTNKLDINDGVYRCSNHGPMPSPTYRYNFKLYITDNTETVMLTCFTPKADAIVGTDCHTLVNSLTHPDPKEFPEKISSLVGKKHIFQFHFNTTNKHGPPDFILNEILDKTSIQKQLEATTSGSLSANEPYKTIQYEPDVSQTNTSTLGESTPPPTVMEQEVMAEKQIAAPSDQKSTKRQLFQGKPSDTKKTKKE